MNMSCCVHVCCKYAKSFPMLSHCTRFVSGCVILIAVSCQEITAKLLQT
jgi:hypothetical protein